MGCSRLFFKALKSPPGAVYRIQRMLIVRSAPPYRFFTYKDIYHAYI